MKQLEGNKAPRNPLSCFFILSFTFSLTPSINTSESSNDVIILMLFLPSFELNKEKPFPALIAPFPLIVFRIYSLHLKLNCLRIQVNYL